jgi:plastocyanin
VLVATLLAASAAAGTVSGRIELRDSKSPAVRVKKDYSGVVVWLERGASPPAPTRARMIQKDKTFTPHILPVGVGSTVDFPNFDPIFHNAFSNYNGQLFDIGLYAPGSSRSVRFTRPGVVRVFCNIHAAMSAVIVVLNTPHFAMSRRDGAFEIAGVPGGAYTLRVFHERAAPETLEEASRRVTVPPEPLALGRITLSESGYLAAPHYNKYGREYGSEPDEAAYATPRR